MFVAAKSLFIVVGILMVFLVIGAIVRFIKNRKRTKPTEMATLPSFVGHLADSEIIDERPPATTVVVLERVRFDEDSEDNTERTSYAQTPLRRVSQSAPTRVARSPLPMNDEDAEVMHRYVEKGRG